MEASRVSVEPVHDYFVGRFAAMASPCEVLAEAHDRAHAEQLTQIAAREAWRIEQKFSRYRTDNIIHAINHGQGAPVTVDEETAQLLDYAARCFELSDGAFDITSGVLRRAWKFDGSDRLPAAEQVATLLPLVGWHKVRWQRPTIALPPGMEIDLGGIGKEYAVDRALLLVKAHCADSVLVNFGGDLAASGPRRNGQAWIVGIEKPTANDANVAHRVLEIRGGGIATSGDAKRYLLKDGVRYSHILDPHSGWPVQHAPRSVTVAASTCTEAGMLATFAMLRGAQAEEFLAQQGVNYWCARE